jgi:hypothetical protein
LSSRTAEAVAAAKLEEESGSKRLDDVEVKKEEEWKEITNSKTEKEGEEEFKVVTGLIKFKRTTRRNDLRLPSHSSPRSSQRTAHCLSIGKLPLTLDLSDTVE